MLQSLLAEMQRRPAECAEILQDVIQILDSFYLDKRVDCTSFEKIIYIMWEDELTREETVL